MSSAQDRPAFGSYVPLTERVLAVTGNRGPVIEIVALIPLVHLVVIWWLLHQAGLTDQPIESVGPGILGRVMNAYLVLICVWASTRFAAGLGVLEGRLVASQGDAPDLAEWRRRLGSWRTWLLPPVLLSIVLTVPYEINNIAIVGADRAAAQPLPFVVSAILAAPIRLVQMTAFWTALLALLATARVGRDGALGTFPEDRSLGFAPVGRTVFEIFVVYAAAFVPLFVLGPFRLLEFATFIALFLGGIGAMLLATWRVHRRMVAEKARIVADARGRYAAAYRAAETGDPTAGKSGRALLLAEALLRGAESVQEWPFDDRMQRVAALVFTGVITGLVVRLILYAFGI